MPRRRKKNKHLPPCVYPKHGAYWYVKRGKWTRLGKGLNEALEAYATIHEPGGGMPSLVDRALARHRGKISDATARQYATAATRIKKAFREFAPSQVRPKHIAKFNASLAHRPNMANRCISVLRIVFAYAAEWQEVDSNPCVGFIRHDETKRGRYLTDGEYAAIYAHAGARLQIIMDLLYLTGQRVRDVLEIRRADLTAEGIEFQPRKTRRKTGIRFTVAWTPELEAAVARAKSLRGNVHALTLLHGRRGRAPDYRTVQNQWQQACAKAGVTDAQMRDLRAKSLTDAKRQGHDATALAGHASPRMTDRYIRLREAPLVRGPSKVLDMSDRQARDS